MDNKIFKQMFPGIDEKYLERAFRQIEREGCPEGEDLLVWFGKLVKEQIMSEATGKVDDEEYS